MIARVLNLRSLYQLLRLGGSSGFLRESALGILRYVRFDFHPWQTDDSKYVDEFLNFVEPHVVK
jgi:predicted metal-dependent hydrolase